MFFNIKTKGFLSSDLYDPVGTTDEAYYVSTTERNLPSVRTVFLIEKYEKERDLFTDDVVHYG